MFYKKRFWKESNWQSPGSILIEMMPCDRMNSIHDFPLTLVRPFPPFLDRFIFLSILWRVWKTSPFFSVMLKSESHEFIFLKITGAAYSDHFFNSSTFIHWALNMWTNKQDFPYCCLHCFHSHWWNFRGGSCSLRVMNLVNKDLICFPIENNS